MALALWPCAPVAGPWVCNPRHLACDELHVELRAR
jgi:hypothetical protein